MRCVLPCGSLWGVIQTSYWERSGLSPCFTACIYSYNFPMTQEARELLQKALALPDNERAELAGNLISSLDATVDQDVDAAWQQEVVRRLHEEDGVKFHCAVNLHNAVTVSQQRLGRRVAQLSAARMNEVCAALRFSLGCDSH